MIGFVVFGAAVVMAPRLSRWGGALLALGAVGFLITTVVNGPFWGDPNPTPSLVPGIMFGFSLLLIAVGWAVLGVVRPGGTR
jgi:formate/nitrite transporter FocA (FNT family)